MGLSVREVAAVLPSLGIDRSHGAVWHWTYDFAEIYQDSLTVEPSRVAVAERQIEMDGKIKWLYAAINGDPKCLLEIDVHSYFGADPAAASLREFTEEHEVDNTGFLVGGISHSTALAWLNLSDHFDCNNHSRTNKWFPTVMMRINRFHSIWMGSSASVYRWLNRFRYYHDRQRPSQDFNQRTPAEEVVK